MPLLGSPMARDHIAALLERGVRMRFFQQYRLRGDQYSQLFNVGSSVKKTETDAIMAGLGTFLTKDEGDSYTYDNGQQAWTKTYTHLTYAKGIAITQEGMEDDLYSFYSQMGSELGRTAAYTREVDAMALFNNLSDTVYTAAGTNFTLLSTTHHLTSGGSWANRPTVAVDLSIEALEDGLIDWRTNMVDQRGLKILVRPKWLLVGPSDEWIAKRIVRSEKRPGGNDNDPNVIRDRDLEVFVSDFMTDDTRWFLLAPKAETGMNYFNRVPVRMDRMDDNDTGNMLMVARYRSSSGASHVSGIFGSPA